mmetsp:Transcript_718/g.1262  ORF Transcript_718/g.1262 Transcript_718/m.1262 type:complete len:83 (+) Transcript_718:47-295(+)
MISQAQHVLFNCKPSKQHRKPLCCQISRVVDDEETSSVQSQKKKKIEEERKWAYIFNPSYTVSRRQVVRNKNYLFSHNLHII